MSRKERTKNNEIQWRKLELSAFYSDVVYWSRQATSTANALSRRFCSLPCIHWLVNSTQNHKSPGLTRLRHFVNPKDHPFYVEDLKVPTNHYETHVRVKPRSTTLFMTSPMKLLNLLNDWDNLKGSKPFTTKNRTLLAAFDEYFHFTHVFACSDSTANTIKFDFRQLFSIFDLPSGTHSDRSPPMCDYVKRFPQSNSSATSQIRPYSLYVNDLVQRLNGKQ